MSDTPRTDEQINGKPCTQFGLLAGMSLRDALVPSEFARQLERELLSAQCKAKDRLKSDTDFMNRIGELTDESAEKDKHIMLLYGEMVKYRTKNFALMALSKINDNQVNSFIRIVEAAEQRNKK